MTKRILILGNYPVVNPQHGGQKRVEAIYRAYKGKSWSVMYVAIIPSKFYLMRGKHDIAVSESTMHAIEAQPLLGDILCGEAVYDDPKVKSRLLGIIMRFSPDIIQLEQPYIYLGLKKLLADINYSGKIINSTQNIEFRMKEDIYKGEGMPAPDRKRIVEKIRALEKDLAQDAVLNVAVSEKDATQLADLLDAKNIIVIANGMNQAKPEPYYIRKWKHYFRARDVQREILFVGSAHQPNMTGFMKMVGKKVGFLPKHARIVVVGGVSDLIKDSLRDEVVEDVCMPLRVELLGRRSEGDLNALLSLADTIILPITEGGGSNLKTAEALLSGKRIVATEHAFRGYDAYRTLPGIDITDSPQRFREFIERNVESSDSLLLPRPETEGVLWEHILADLTERVEQL